MSEIDTDRLKADPSIWPDEATHFNQDNSLFYKCEGGKVYHGKLGDWLVSTHGSHSLIEHPATIPRPTKQEWDGGLPPVGWHGECTWGQKINWFECIMLPRYCLALYKHGEWSFMDMFPQAGHEFRPIKSQHERQREELIRVIKESDGMAYSFRPDDIADAVIKFYEEHYNLEEK